MWETSKSPAALRTARCSSMTPEYWTGMRHPANSTSLAPARTWASWRGVCLSSSDIASAVQPSTRGEPSLYQRKAGPEPRSRPARRSAGGFDPAANSLPRNDLRPTDRPPLWKKGRRRPAGPGTAPGEVF